MEFINDPSQTDSDRPDYAKMRGPVNCRQVTEAGVNSGIGSEGGSPTRSSVPPEVTDTERPAHPVINNSEPNAKDKAAVASVKTTRKEKNKVQADEPIEEEGNISATISKSKESDEENEGTAKAKADSDRPDYAKMRGPDNCQRRTDTELTSSEGGGPPFPSVTPKVTDHASPVINQSVPNTMVTLNLTAAASVEEAGKEEIKEPADEPIEEEGNVVTTESEERDEENEGQADNKKGLLLSMLVRAFCLLLIIEGAGFAKVNTPSSEESDVPIEEGNGVTTSSESEERDEENEGQAGISGSIPSSEESDVPFEEEGNGVTAGSETEEWDEENEGQAGISGLLVKAFWAPFAAALRLTKAAKFVITLGVVKIEAPLAALWRDD